MTIVLDKGTYHVEMHRVVIAAVAGVFTTQTQTIDKPGAILAYGATVGEISVANDFSNLRMTNSGGAVNIDVGDNLTAFAVGILAVTGQNIEVNCWLLIRNIGRN